MEIVPLQKEVGEHPWQMRDACWIAHGEEVHWRVEFDEEVRETFFVTT